MAEETIQVLDLTMSPEDLAILFNAGEVPFQPVTVLPVSGAVVVRLMASGFGDPLTVVNDIRARVGDDGSGGENGWPKYRVHLVLDVDPVDG